MLSPRALAPTGFTNTTLSVADTRLPRASLSLRDLQLRFSHTTSSVSSRRSILKAVVAMTEAWLWLVSLLEHAVSLAHLLLLLSTSTFIIYLEGTVIVIEFQVSIRFEQFGGNVLLTIRGSIHAQVSEPLHLLTDLRLVVRNDFIRVQILVVSLGTQR